MLSIFGLMVVGVGTKVEGLLVRSKGNVQSNELRGEPYNNISGFVVSKLMEISGADKTPSVDQWAGLASDESGLG